MELWKYPYDVKKLKLPQDIELAYIDEGVGSSVLLFIHGLGSNIKGWKKNIEGLKNSFRCIAVDLPGYGKSSKDDYPFGMLFFSEVLQAFINQLGLTNINVVGHSMGGQIALKLVIQNSQLIDSLILLAPAGLETFTKSEKEHLLTVTSPEVLENLSVDQIVYNFKVNFCEMPDDALFMIEDRLLLRDDHEYIHFCRMVSSCVIGMLDDPVIQDLDKVNVPVLIIFGKEDQLIPNKLLHPHLTTEMIAEIGQRKVPACTLKMVNGAGHFIQWEQSGRVNQEIIQFVDDIG